LKKNNSLLFVGIKNIINSFEKGDVINCMNEKNVCIAKGITNYKSEDIVLLKGKSTENIISEYGNKFTKEVIHADNLIVIEI
jgi:glutamate 5-kinase